MCLGCRQRAERSTLVRVVARDGNAVVDASATMFGRGAWVHPTRDCVESAITRKAFGRALRVDGLQVSEQVFAAVQLSDEEEVPSGATEDKAD